MSVINTPTGIRVTRNLGPLGNGATIGEEDLHDFTRQTLDQLCSQLKVKRVVPIIKAGQAYCRRFVVGAPQARGLELIPSLYVRQDPYAHGPRRAYVAGRPSFDEMNYALGLNNGQWLLIDGVAGDGVVLKTAASWLIEQGVPRESIMALAAFCDPTFKADTLPIAPEQCHTVFWGEPAAGHKAELFVPVYLPHQDKDKEGLAGISIAKA